MPSFKSLTAGSFFRWSDVVASTNEILLQKRDDSSYWDLSHGHDGPREVLELDDVYTEKSEVVVVTMFATTLSKSVSDVVVGVYAMHADEIDEVWKRLADEHGNATMGDAVLYWLAERVLDTSTRAFSARSKTDALGVVATALPIWLIVMIANWIINWFTNRSRDEQV